MSTATSSPRVIDNTSQNFAAFRASTFKDPFLAGPSLGDDQLIGTDVGRRSIENEEDGLLSPYQYAVKEESDAQGYLTSPADTHTYPPYSRSLQPSPASHQDLSPDYAYNGCSDLSTYTTPGEENTFAFPFEFALSQQLGNDPADFAATQDIYCPVPQDAKAPKLGYTEQDCARNPGITDASQLLSPVLTDTPSSPSEFQRLRREGSVMTPPLPATAGRISRVDTPAYRIQCTPALTTSPLSDSLEVGPQTHATSPIVKVSSYTRGDSPSRVDEPGGCGPGKRSRVSLSSGHLAPAGEDLTGDLGDGEDHVGIASANPVPVLTPTLRAGDGSWIANTLTGQGGLDPMSRGNIFVPSVKDMDEQRKREEKNANVEQWLSRSEASSEIGEPDAPTFRSRRRKQSLQSRRRAKSTGDAFPSGPDCHFFDDSGIPGPGALIYEESGLEDGDDEDVSDASESGTHSPPAEVDLNIRDESPEGSLPAFETIDTINAEPLPRQFIRARPWQDSPRNTSFGGSKVQPLSANAAIMRFLRRADNIETASRKATWGTRRLSESDVDSVIGAGGSFESLCISKHKKKPKSDRSNGLLGHASKLLPKRSNSNTKRKLAESAQQCNAEPVDKATKAKDSKDGGAGSSALPQRKSSFTRSALKTNEAVLAMTSQIAAVGGGSGPTYVSPSLTGATSWAFRKRNRSKSETPRISKPSGSGGLFELMTSVGGPPVPTLASPMQDRVLAPSPLSGKAANDDDDDEDDEEDEVMEGKGVVMDLTIRAATIVPSPEGFKIHIQQLNPRLQPALIERIAQEQVRRYKKLVDLKIKHAQVVSLNKCGAGRHCFDQGGEATMLPPRTSLKDPDSTYAQFQVSGPGVTDDELNNNFGEGTVTAALFPPGVPLPPVRRLPAEFECSLCFKVKRFQKPSDWTKHVHEDVQPFTCTFPGCSEPKSFKRKADWVRHESERHRQLEWWTCNMPDCSHTCYRKDNFVQHLVREHKMPEPKIKSAKIRGIGNSKPAASQSNPVYIRDQQASNHEQAVDQVWKLVEECRHSTSKQPKDEPCRFCNNVCNSWKKLTVHMAKHMEQIAMPVLELVKERVVSADTIISPIERGNFPSLPQRSTRSPVSPLPASGASASSVTAYSTPLQINHSSSNDVGPASFYGTVPQNAEPYGVSPTSMLSDPLHVQNELAGRSQGADSMAVTATTTQYASISPYSVSTAQPNRGPNAYSTTQVQQPFAPHLNPATYPPPYDGIPRQTSVSVPTSQQLPTTRAQYALDMDNQHSLYASPDNLLYVYQPGQGSLSQSVSLPYAPTSAGIEYPTIAGQDDGPTDQQARYLPPGATQYSYPNQ